MKRTKRNGYKFIPLLSACVVLRRLSMEDEWCDMEILFRKFAPQLAEIFRDGLQSFMVTHGKLFSSDIPKLLI